MAGEIVRPSALPPRSNPVATEVVPSDNGSVVGGVTWAAGVAAGRPLANQAEAEAGVNATKAMTPLTTKQAINAQAVLALVAGDNTTIDATDPQNPVVSYNGAGVTDGDKGDVVVSASGTAWQVARRFDTVALLLADTDMDYTSGAQVVSAGQIVEAQGFRYEVVADDSTEYSLVPTAGNVKSKVREFSVKPEAWGAIAGVVSGAQRSINTAAFRAWLRYICETGVTGYIPFPLYEVDSFIVPDGAVGNTAINLKIVAPNGCTIDYQGATSQNIILSLELTNLNYGYVEGVHINGRNKVNSGLWIRSARATAEALVARYCGGENLRIQEDGTAYSGSAVRIQADNATKLNYAEIYGCTARNLTKAVRTGGTLPMQGLVIVNADNVRFDNNTVENVRHDGATLEDADGFVLFAGQDSGAYRRMAGSMDNNIARNCEGRGFKFQASGTWVASNNIVEINDDSELVYAWTAFDNQTGDCSLTNNEIVMGDQWTGGDGARAMALQVPAVPGSNMVSIKVDGLKFNTGKELSRLFEFLPKACAAKVDISIEKVFARGKGALTSSAAGDCAAAFFGVATGQSGLSASDNYTIATRDLDVHCRAHYSLAVGTSGLSSWTDIVSLKSENDTCYPLTSGKPFWNDVSSAQTSSLMVRGSRIGLEGRVNGDLDWAKFQSGFDAYVGSGTMSNAGSQTFVRVNKAGPLMMTQPVGSGGSIKVSGDNGANWSAAIA